MKECDGCGNENVSDDFHRVYSDNDGYLPGCVECTTQKDRKRMHT